MYLIVFSLNVYWFKNGNMLSQNRQIFIVLLSVFVFVFAVFLQCMGAGSNRKKIAMCAGYILFIYYIYILLELLFIGNLFMLPRADGGSGRMNLVPFRTIYAYASLFERYPNMASVTNIIGNLLIFMPMSILLPLLFRPMRHWYLYLPFLGLLLVAIEVLQKITGRGRADIDDVILNFAGAFAVYLLFMIGMIVFRLIKKFTLYKSHKKV